MNEVFINHKKIEFEHMQEDLMYVLSTTISQCHKKSWIIRVNVIKLSKYLQAYQLLDRSKCNQLPFLGIFPCTSIAKQKQNISLIFNKVTT
jgi:hypothetical protein